MRQYKCLRPCQYAGRVFAEGEIYLSDSCDSPFFGDVGEFVSPPSVEDVYSRIGELDAKVEKYIKLVDALMCDVYSLPKDITQTLEGLVNKVAVLEEWQNNFGTRADTKSVKEESGEVVKRPYNRKNV